MLKRSAARGIPHYTLTPHFSVSFLVTLVQAPVHLMPKHNLTSTKALKEEELIHLAGGSILAASEPNGHSSEQTMFNVWVQSSSVAFAVESWSLRRLNVPSQRRMRLISKEASSSSCKNQAKSKASRKDLKKVPRWIDPGESFPSGLVETSIT